MDWSRLPPLSALRAFAVFAETGSVTRAGALLNVTHAAISQQIRALETHLGVPLLVRSGRNLALTPDGETLAQGLRSGFGDIAAAVSALTDATATRSLHVATTPSFAAYWLMPRLGAFRARHPGVDLLINPSIALTDPAPGGVDVAIRYGAGTWPGLDAEPLLPSPIVVVAAPSLLNGRSVADPSELSSFPWLQETGGHEASTWLERRGVTAGRKAGLTQLPGHLLLEGARTGQGVAVTTEIFVRDDLAAGRLNLLFRDPEGRGYHIVTAPGVMRPPLRGFVAWLRATAEKS